MNTWLNRWRAFRGELAFYRILRDWATQQEGGSTVMAEFESDRQQGRSLLRHFLQTQLTDEIARQELIEALGNRHNQFVNVVTNSQVGKIVNIAEAGAVYWKITVFSSVRQVVALVGMIVLVAAALGAGVWYLNQPRQMTGAFNIAVASFAPGDDSQETKRIAAAFSQRLAQFLDAQQLPGVEVQHRHIGIIPSTIEADALATRINAHIVIYGSVLAEAGEATVFPIFWVADNFRPDVRELNGESRLTIPITTTTRAIMEPSDPNIQAMEQRFDLLLEFTKALVYLQSNQLLEANQAIVLTLERAEAYPDLPGQEIFYLFASQIARLRQDHEQAEQYVQAALNLDSQYGRAYIAWANIAYDRGDFYAAVQKYELAQQIGETNLDRYLPAKASLGLANICSVELQTVLRRDEVEIAAANELAECARTNYNQVIRYYADQSTGAQHPNLILQKLAAQAYYGMGLIYEATQNQALAKQMYEIAFTLADDPTLRATIQQQLDQVD